MGQSDFSESDGYLPMKHEVGLRKEFKCHVIIECSHRMVHLAIDINRCCLQSSRMAVKYSVCGDAAFTKVFKGTASNKASSTSKDIKSEESWK